MTRRQAKIDHACGTVRSQQSVCCFPGQSPPPAMLGGALHGVTLLSQLFSEE